MAYTWVQFRNVVKSLMSDATLNDTTAVMAIAEYVKAYIVREVDKDIPRAANHQQQWTIQRDRLLGWTVLLTTEQLRAEVDKYLTVDKDRHGVQQLIDVAITAAKNDLAGAANFIDRQIRQGTIELQHFIEYYRRQQERVFTFGDAVADGEASRLTLPEHCMIQDVYYVKDGSDCLRMPVSQYDWQNRYDLICGEPRLNGHEFYAAISPDGTKLVTYPALLDGYHLSVFYDGIKLEFADGDSCPFDEPFAQAVADFVRWKMYQQPPAVNLKLADYHYAEYRNKRLHLYRDAKDKVRIRFTNDSPFPLGYCHCASCEDADDEGGSGTGTGGCSEIITVATLQAMRELTSMPCRKLVFVLNENGPWKTYKAKYGDTTAADEPAIIASIDGLTRYFEFALS